MAWLKQVKLWGSVLLVVVFFVTTSYLAHRHERQLTQVIDQASGLISVPGYIILIAVLTVVAPTTSLPLVPPAAQVWGGLGAGLMTAAGWIIGGMIGFWIARTYGQEAVKHLASTSSLEQMQKYVPRNQEHLFWLLAALEALLPTDILSYGVGLFTRIGPRMYAGALTLGNIVSGIFFAYLGTLPLGWELASFALGGVIILLSYRVVWRGKDLFS